MAVFQDLECMAKAFNGSRVFLKRYNPEKKKIRFGSQTDKNGLSDPLYPRDWPVLMAA